MLIHLLFLQSGFVFVVQAVVRIVVTEKTDPSVSFGANLQAITGFRRGKLVAVSQIMDWLFIFLA